MWHLGLGKFAPQGNHLMNLGTGPMLPRPSGLRQDLNKKHLRYNAKHSSAWSSIP